MPRILAFDQSITNCGFAIYDGGDERRIVCGSFSAAEGTDSLDKRCRFGRRLKQLIGQWRPQFVCFEQASQRIVAYPRKPGSKKKGGAGWLPEFDAAPMATVNAGQLLLPGIESQILQACIDYSIPFDCVGPKTWRKAILSNGNLAKAAAKSAARAHCKLLGIPAANHDEAEAALIAMWANRCSQKYRELAKASAGEAA